MCKWKDVPIYTVISSAIAHIANMYSTVNTVRSAVCVWRTELDIHPWIDQSMYLYLPDEGINVIVECASISQKHSHGTRESH